MTTNMKTATDLLFGKEGLGVSNFKMFPGFNRKATSEQIAAEVTKALHDVAGGRGEELPVE